MLTKGVKFDIQSYKHNEIIHRVWKDTEIVENDGNMLVTAHKKTRVYEQSGRSWFTKEPAVCYFYKDSWFNVIAMLKKTGIVYYCNISSPYLFDGEAIKYIDYDLDVKLFPNGEYVVLDKNEYKYHAKIMEYSEDLKIVIQKELERLIIKIKNKEVPFNEEYVINHYKQAFEK